MGEKKIRIKKALSNYFGKDKVSLHRTFVLLTSIRGQKKILGFGIRTIRFVLGLKSLNNRLYQKWIKTNFPNLQTQDLYLAEAKAFAYKPLISIILPVYNPPINFLEDAIQSVITQLYGNWELCISDDKSPNPEVRELIKSYAQKDSRIKYVFRTENGHISANSNSALELATGEFIALLDHDDLLTIDALFQNVKVLNSDQSIDFIYSDEDKLDEENSFIDPFFKQDWSPETFLARNYLCHFSVIRRSLVTKVGGFTIGLEGSQDYDLFLRVTEQTNKIHHIAKILYHWRLHQDSTALNSGSKMYAFEAGLQAIKAALQRRNIEASVNHIPDVHGYYSVRYTITKPGKVSILIPTKNKADLCEGLLKSIFEKTSYKDFEIIIINNNSDEASFFELIKKWEKKYPAQFKCVDDSGDFNFSRLMNNGRKNASGEYLLLLNNDTEVIHADWLSAMIEHVQFKEIGAVGVKLLYRNETIQHGGVIIGMGGIAGHHQVGLDKDAGGHFYQLGATTNYSAVTGACLMVRAEVFDDVNGFDENLPVDFNDVDFCLKLIDKGYRNVYLPHVILYHYESISRGHPFKTKKSFLQHLKDCDYFRSKWLKYIEHDPYYNPNLSRVFGDFRVNVKD